MLVGQSSTFRLFTDLFTAQSTQGQQLPALTGASFNYSPKNQQTFETWNAANKDKDFYLSMSAGSVSLSSVSTKTDPNAQNAVPNQPPQGALKIDKSLAYGIQSGELRPLDWLQDQVAADIRREALGGTSAKLAAAPDAGLVFGPSMETDDLALLLRRLGIASQENVSQTAGDGLKARSSAAAAFALAAFGLAEAKGRLASFEQDVVKASPLTPTEKTVVAMERVAYTQELQQRQRDYDSARSLYATTSATEAKQPASAKGFASAFADPTKGLQAIADAATQAQLQRTVGSPLDNVATPDAFIVKTQQAQTREGRTAAFAEWLASPQANRFLGEAGVLGPNGVGERRVNEALAQAARKAGDTAATESLAGAAAPAASTADEATRPASESESPDRAAGMTDGAAATATTKENIDAQASEAKIAAFEQWLALPETASFLNQAGVLGATGMDAQLLSDAARLAATRGGPDDIPSIAAALITERLGLEPAQKLEQQVADSLDTRAARAFSELGTPELLAGLMDLTLAATLDGPVDDMSAAPLLQDRQAIAALARASTAQPTAATRELDADTQFKLSYAMASAADNVQRRVADSLLMQMLQDNPVSLEGSEPTDNLLRPESPRSNPTPSASATLDSGLGGQAEGDGVEAAALGRDEQDVRLGQAESARVATNSFSEDQVAQVAAQLAALTPSLAAQLAEAAASSAQALGTQGLEARTYQDLAFQVASLAASDRHTKFTANVAAAELGEIRQTLFNDRVADLRHEEARSESFM